MMMLLAITAVLCAISFWVMITDQESQLQTIEKNAEETAVETATPPKLYTKSMLIYSAVMLCVTLAIAVELSWQGLESTDEMIVAIKQMSLLCILWPLAYIDFKSFRIPNKFIILGLIYRVVILALELLLQVDYIGMGLLSDVIAAVALFIAAIMCALCIKNSIGYGDIKLFIVMGLLLGMEYVWSAIFMALVVSFFVALFVLITRKKSRKDVIPFAPAIVLGTYLAIFIMGM